MKNPLKTVRWLSDWLDDRIATLHDRKLDRLYAPKVAEAEKAKDWEKREELLHEWQFESQLTLDPVYARKAERLTAKARKYGITVSPRPTSYNAESEDWRLSNATGDWLLSRSAEERLRREIKVETRASYEEFRKWATLAFAVAGFTLAFYSVRTKDKQSDPCQRNYYRADSGQCVFVGQPSTPPNTQPADTTAQQTPTARREQNMTGKQQRKRTNNRARSQP